MDELTKSDFAIIVSVESETYEEGLREVNEIAEGLGAEGVNASAVLEYERDAEDRRILRLHPVYEFDESGHKYPAMTHAELERLDHKQEDFDEA